MNKDSMIYLFEWDDMCEDLTDEEFGRLIRSVSKYAQTSEKATFSDRMLKSNFKTMTKAIDRFDKKYEAKCEKNRVNGKKGGRPKNESVEKPNGFSENPKKANGFFENPPERERDREPERDPYPERERGRGGDSEREAAAPHDTTTTTDLKDRIIQEWNRHDFVQKIKTLNTPSSRWLNTLTAVRTAGGEEEFIKLIRSLGDHAYFRDQNKKGYRVVYDWFINLDNFQGVIEGRYKDSRSKYGDDWEVVDLG